MGSGAPLIRPGPRVLILLMLMSLLPRSPLIAVACAALLLTGCAGISVETLVWEPPTRIERGRVALRSDVAPALAAEVAEEAEAFLARLESWSGRAESEGVQVYLFKSYVDFQARMKSQGEGVTYLSADPPLIGLPLWPFASTQEVSTIYAKAVTRAVGSDWRYRLRHELVHVFFREAEGLERDWLWEGIADYLANDGDRGDGLKAQRFLVLQRALADDRLTPLERLRSSRVNASQPSAELLYADSWSLVYALLKLTEPAVQRAALAWFKDGAPGGLDDVLTPFDLDLAAIDRLRRRWIGEAFCFLEAEAAAAERNPLLREGDVLLAANAIALGPIFHKADLRLRLFRLLTLGSVATARRPLRLYILRAGRPAVLSSGVGRFSGLHWRLTVRRAQVPDASWPPGLPSGVVDRLRDPDFYR